MLPFEAHNGAARFLSIMLTYHDLFHRYHNRIRCTSSTSYLDNSLFWMVRFAFGDGEQLWPNDCTKIPLTTDPLTVRCGFKLIIRLAAQLNSSKDQERF
ncbi:hypothetical protein GJ744_010730 [Endocarpon pusillum]|uniref:Uncharacterized protein n=1 Tax=Endocarpon pusillum TaxID=364733 RepID=A0A8H7E5B3_9EURO|nr:hypothetical protein GJ744_010730 [Endocarpon pusillum]